MIIYKRCRQQISMLWEVPKSSTKMSIQDSKSCTSFYFTKLYNVKILKRRIQHSESSKWFPTPATQILARASARSAGHASNVTNTPLFCVNVKYDRVKVTRIRNSLMDEELWTPGVYPSRCPRPRLGIIIVFQLLSAVRNMIIIL